MEVHVFRRLTVHRPLRLGQQPEDAGREILPGRVEVTVTDVPEDVGQVPFAVGHRGRGDHGAQAGQAAAPGGFGPQAETGHAEGGNDRAHPLHVGARVEQGAEEHVAGHARGRVDVGGARPIRHRCTAWMILAACTAAPNPLSMLTTARPGLHEDSMVAAAARPPAATP